MKDKVTKPVEKAYDEFLECAGRMDLLWSLRRNTAIARENVESPDKSKDNFTRLQEKTDPDLEK